MKVSIAESALADLEEILHYYRERDAEGSGRRAVSAILQRIEQLIPHPESGRIVPEFDAPFLRELIEPPFRIVYRHDKDRVRVVELTAPAKFLRRRGTFSQRLTSHAGACSSIPDPAVDRAVEQDHRQAERDLQAPR